MGTTLMNGAPTTPSLIEVYVHPLPSANLDVRDEHHQSKAQASHIESLLESHLPYTNPLLRRLQHHPHHSSATLLATFPQSTEPTPSTNGHPSPQQPPDPVFTIAYLDDDATQGPRAWTFSSIELEGYTFASATSAQLPQAAAAKDKQATTQLLSIVSRYLRDKPRDKLILLHSLNARLARALRYHHPSLVRDDVSGPGGPYRKYLIPLPPTAPPTQTQTHSQPQPQPQPQPQTRTHAQAEPTFTTSPVHPSEFPRVAATNALVRSPSTLHPLANAGLRAPGGRLAAWAFRGVDGSVRTLFVEPEWRGRGLAGRVVRALLAGIEGEEGMVVHADVEGGNEGSVRVFEGVGGEWAWDAFWVRLDVEGVLRWADADAAAASAG